MHGIDPKGRLRPAIALLAGCLPLFTACSRSHTVTTSDGKITYKEKDKDAASVTVTGKDGQTATLDFNQNKVPDDYPKDLPVYASGKVMMSQSASDKNARSLMLESSDPSDKIASFYKKELDSKGWKTESTVSTGQMNMISASKDQKQLMIQITDSGEKRSIMQLVSDKS